MADETTITIPQSSRFKDTPLVQASNGSLEWGLWVRDEGITIGENSQLHTVIDSDIGRLDRVAYSFYGDSDFWWIIAMVNNLVDPVNDMTVGQILTIPNRVYIDTFYNRGPKAQ